MRVPVVAAVTGTRWEADLVSRLERETTDITVVRRCVDLADLLATAATGTARAVLLSADLRRLDRDALARLSAGGLAVVGLVTPGDAAAEQRLRQLGVRHVLDADSSAPAISAAVSSALAELSMSSAPTSYSDPLAGYDDRLPPDAAPLGGVAAQPGTGRLIAVWGPTGAPGRTTVGIGIATELARGGVSTMLADADVYGGVVGAALGLLDEAPGLAAAARLANNGQLDLRSLAGVAPLVAANLRVLTGISRASRWPELRPAALEQVWALSRSLVSVTVIDCGFSVELDEELTFDTSAPRRNGATVQTLEQADVVLAVGAADPLGMQRLLRGLSELGDVAPSVAPRVVLNKVRRGAVGPDPRRQLAQALDRYAGVEPTAFLPYDRDPLDVAILQGRALCEVAPKSPLRLALAALADGVGEHPAPRSQRRRLAGRRA